MRILGGLFGRPSRLSCRQVGPLLQSYLDGELDQDVATRVEAHVEQCRRCGFEAEVYAALTESLRTVPVGSSPASLARLRQFGERVARGEIDPSTNPDH